MLPVKNKRLDIAPCIPAALLHIIMKPWFPSLKQDSCQANVMPLSTILIGLICWPSYD